MFYVGQKVVVAGRSEQPPPNPQVGRVYTVADLWTDADGDRFIDLAELPNPGSAWFCAGYLARHFRPVVTTDISIFTAMLSPVRERSDAHS